jgi:LPXTG-site transpeptidase (sortase) family protein
MTLEADAGDVQAMAGTSERKSRGLRARFLRALFGVGVLGIVASAGMVSYELMRPAEAEAPVPVVIDASRWHGDPGAVYDRIPITPTPSPVPTPGPTPVPPAIDSSPYQLTIDSIGVNAPVVAKGVDANRVPVVPLNGWQVAWYTFSAQPGTGGNAVFAGHVTWGGRAVFYSLNKLAIGDTIRVSDNNGNSFVYTVNESFSVAETDPNAAAEVMGPTSSDIITLITCDGEFYYTGDPVFNGSYTARRIIRAVLTSSNLVSVASSG